MGRVRVRVRDRSEERRFETPDWDGDVTVAVDESGELELAVSADSPFTPETVTVAEREPRRAAGASERCPDWLLLAPGLFGGLALGTVETGLVTVLSGEFAWVLSVGLYWLCFLTGAIGTVALVRDARWRAEHSDGWSPNPWHYVLGGGAAVTGATLVVLGVPSGTANEVVGALTGMAIVGCVLASVAAGPAYLFARRRRS